MLLAYSVAVFVRRKTVSAVFQLVGATCLVVVVLTHIAEALHVLPAMRWGEPDRVGHYIDLSSAVLGVTAHAFRLHSPTTRIAVGPSSFERGCDASET